MNFIIRLQGFLTYFMQPQKIEGKIQLPIQNRSMLEETAWWLEKVAGALILEEYNHAKKRGAKIPGELIAYSTSCDGEHMTSPSFNGMYRCMKDTLNQSAVDIDTIDYINAHATGTKLGDIAESQAIKKLCGDRVPVSATKGFTGHTLAASGVMEVIFSLLMMANDVIIPTLHLQDIDSDCDGIFHVKKKINIQLNRIMTSNFAFGGINATLVLQKINQQY